MSEPRWEQAIELFERAADLPPDERAAWLDDHCPDPALRAEVQAMLRGDERSVDLLDRPSELFDAAQEVPLEQPGTRIGAYRLTELLGEGGMGSVWAAEQEEPLRRSVALKLIKPGMDTRQVVARFEAERSVLARMAHPHIARVHDAGATPRGRPYFVMERVEGEPLGTWCDSHDLDIRERVALFLPVCEAVQHAHHKGVVHRDLKPSNILVAQVDGAPHPMVIDFGIAKLLQSEKDDPTRAQRGTRIGTPTYMSPEQVGGLDVDTRSDVYSLGAVLYELLTGVPPLDLAALTPAEAEARIRREVPPTPSTRSRSPRRRPGPARPSPRTPSRELDWIVMKALEKEPERRYSSPHDLAADLRRFLAMEPVLAGPPSRFYRVKTFVRRHRTAVGLSAAALLALILGLFGTTWMAIEAQRARTEAEREARSARAVSDFLSEVLASADPLETEGGVPSREVKVQQVLERARQRLSDGNLDPVVEARLRGVLGRTFVGLEMFEEASTELDTSRVRLATLLGPEHLETLNVAHDRARLHAELGEYEQAADLYGQIATARGRRLGPDHPETLTALSNLGEIQVLTGRLDLAETTFRATLDALRSRLGAEDRKTVTALNNLGFVLRRRGQIEEAEQLYREALQLNRKLVGDAHPHTIAALNNLGALLIQSDRLDEAEEHFAEGFELSSRVHGDTGVDTLNIRSSLALVRMRQGRLEEAEAEYRAIVEGYRATLGPEHPHTLRNLNNLARVLADRGATDRALALYRDLLPTTDRALPVGHPYRAMFRAGYGKVLHSSGDDDRARVELATALPGLRAALGDSHPSTVSAADLLEELGG